MKPPRLPRLRMEPRVLLAVLAVATAVWAFVAIGNAVLAGSTHALDAALLLAMREPGVPADPLGPRWLEEFARDLTALGSMGVLGLLVAACAGFLALAGRRRSALFALAATTSGALLSSLLKEFFGRERPDIVPHATYVLTASFPSGHAMLSVLVYLTLGALVARQVRRRRLKLYVMALALGLSAAVGASRIYLGVHWPSDVLAGWVAGAAWALLWWGVAQASSRAPAPGARLHPGRTVH